MILALLACGPEADTGRAWEGRTAGECADGADNDGDEIGRAHV